MNTSRTQYETSVSEDPERHVYYPHVSVINHGLKKNYELGRDFFGSVDYRAFADFAERIDDLMNENGRVVRGEKSESMT